MNPQKGYYSIIQFCPDRGRFEAANIGVMLFCPATGFLKALTSQNNSRIRKFFGNEGRDWKQIGHQKRALQDRLAQEFVRIRNIDDLQQFIAMRANEIQLTNPLPMKVFDPEKDLATLFEQVVGGKNTRESRPNLKSMLAGTFHSAGLDTKILADVEIYIPVLESRVEIPFAFQNGRFNLIRPVRFGTGDPDHAFRTACKHAVEGRSIYEHRDKIHGDMQLVVVGEFRSKTDETSARLADRVFRDNAVRLYRFDELPRLINEIDQSAKEVKKAEDGGKNFRPIILRDSE